MTSFSHLPPKLYPPIQLIRRLHFVYVYTSIVNEPLNPQTILQNPPKHTHKASNTTQDVQQILQLVFQDHIERSLNTLHRLHSHNSQFSRRVNQEPKMVLPWLKVLEPRFQQGWNRPSEEEAAQWGSCQLLQPALSGFETMDGCIYFCADYTPAQSTHDTWIWCFGALFFFSLVCFCAWFVRFLSMLCAAVSICGGTCSPFRLNDGMIWIPYTTFNNLWFAFMSQCVCFLVISTVIIWAVWLVYSLVFKYVFWE